MAYSGMYLPHSSWNALPRRQIICDWSARAGGIPPLVVLRGDLVGHEPEANPPRPREPRVRPQLLGPNRTEHQGNPWRARTCKTERRTPCFCLLQAVASASGRGLLQCRPSSDRDLLARDSVSRSERTPGLWAPTWCPLQPPDGPHPAAIFQCEWGPPIDEDRFTKFPQLRAPVSSCKWGASLVYRP